MGHVIINTGAVMGAEVAVNSSAMSTVRLGFNPSGLEQVDRIKSLAAALISECENLRDEANAAKTAGAREASIAITEAQTACMYAVASATANL
jgi:hypothetical protein